MAHTFVEIDDTTGKFVRHLISVQLFAESYPQYGTYEAIRKRVQRRQHNGLLDCGAVVESNYGNLINAERYAAWALQPRRREVA
jgi:hypothetical protein